MRIKLLTNLGSNDFPDLPFLEGQEYEVTNDVAAKLLRLKLAIDVTPPPLKAAEPEPVVETVVQPEPPAQIETKPTVKPAVSNSKGK